MSKRKPTTSVAGVEPPPRSTKIGILISMLQTDSGADIKGLADATGWQAHSVRGAIAGQIKKKLGLVVGTQRVDGRTIYRIA